MKKYFLSLVLMLITFIAAFATVIKGQVVSSGGDLPRVIFLQCYYDRGFTDSVKIGPYGDFSITTAYNMPAFYLLQSGKGRFSFFINPSSSTLRLSLTINNGNIEKGALEDCRENNAFTDFDKLIRPYDHRLAEIVSKGEPDSTLKTFVTVYNTELDNFQQFYKGTYTADILARMRQIKVDGSSPTALQNLRSNFFAKVNFSDSTILGNIVWANMLTLYSNYICDTTATARQKYIGSVMQQSHTNINTYKTTGNDFFNSFMADMNEEMMEALIAWYSKEADTVLLPALKEKTRKISAVMPGNHFAEVTQTNLTGAPEQLSTSVAKNKYTLLIIWESTCSHCRQTIPAVKSLYTKYNSKGFGVFGVSLDENENDWKSYVAENELSWVNTHADPLSHATYETYYITNFPTLVLINQQGTIVKRLADISQIGDYLDKALK